MIKIFRLTGKEKIACMCEEGKKNTGAKSKRDNEDTDEYIMYTYEREKWERVRYTTTLRKEREREREMGKMGYLYKNKLLRRKGTLITFINSNIMIMGTLLHKAITGFF